MTTIPNKVEFNTMVTRTSSRRIACQRASLGIRGSTALGHEWLETRDCPALVLSISPPVAQILEGDSAVFTVRLSEPSNRPERIGITVAAGTAMLGQDFIFNNSTQLLFSPGQTTRTFTVRTFADSLVEGSETFVITAQSLNRPNVRTAMTATMYDLIPTTVRAEGVRVIEGNAGTTAAVFTMRLQGRPMLPVTVAYSTANVTAVAGSDYTASSGIVSFAPGEFTKTISVPIKGDLEAEVDETFQLNLINPSRGTTIATPTVVGTIVNDETDQPGFQITVEYVTSPYGEVPANVRSATQAAVQRWQQVITGDLPGFLEVSTGLFVDDFRMRVQMGLLGGQGTALANARPVQYRSGGGLPWLGETGINPLQVSNPQMVAILTHEIGHALGFAPGESVFDRWVSGLTWTGPNAIREYRALAGSTVTSVPLESGGGGGTAGAHWSEATFGVELMTGYAEAPGVPMPLSRLTVGAFADLGYTVNYVAADPYVLPATTVPPIGTPPSSPVSPVRPTPRPSQPSGTTRQNGPAATLPETIRRNGFAELATAVGAKRPDRSVPVGLDFGKLLSGDPRVDLWP